LRLDQLPRGLAAQITGIDLAALGAPEVRRLRELGFDEGVAVETLHSGPFGQDPIACRVGRMTVAIRRAQARAIMLEAANAA
jgi:ferrous iron transport protein A